MPTNLDRIQTLLQPEAYAKVRTLAKHNRRALSAMSAELVEEALKLPKYRQQIEDAEIQVPARDDPREAQRQVAITPKTMRPSHYEEKAKEIAAQVAEIVIPTTKPRVDHKGYLMRDGYGNVLLEDEPASQQWKEDYEEMKSDAQTSDDVDARLKNMEEMMAQMAAMMATKA